MREIGNKKSLLKPESLPGLLVLLYFVVKLIAYAHLLFLGRITPGTSGRLDGERMPDPGGEVIYFYQVDEVNHHGWRRGIQYGGQKISVVHSPIMPSFHVTSVKRELQSPFALCREIDFWLRLGLALLGVLLGGFMAAFPHMWRNRTWRFLHGLTREDPRG